MGLKLGFNGCGAVAEKSGRYDSSDEEFESWEWFTIFSNGADELGGGDVSRDRIDESR
jgi:hypothetical protein